MCDVPEILRGFDLDATDEVVRRHLEQSYLDHPTRGPYLKSRELYREVEADIDDQFSPRLFGMFCESRPYLETWSRGYGGSQRYRILPEEL
ncbi:hypothetical protein OB905_10565 [Halobacteria archaeon AArc-dxtr1]|nr:hypothetical protein [Halobacteria archaeon AArc-dxtr1]